MSTKPWHKRYHSDALTGYRGLNLELRGAYTTILDLLYDSGEEALTASERWMAGQLDVSTRKWRAIRDELEQGGKLIVLPDGRITNARYLRELEKVKALSATRADAGAAGGKARATAAVQSKLGSFSGVENTHENDLSGKDKSGEPDPKPAENSDPAQANATANASPRARDPDTRVQSLTQPTPNDSDSGDGSGADDKPDRLGDADLQSLYRAVATASGHNPANPTQIDRAFKFIERWKAEGFDFDRVVLPVIRNVVSGSRDPTRTLGRFDAAIQHEHARLLATPGGRKYVPPASPILEPPGEDERFRPMRAELLERLGPLGYATFCNHVRFEKTEDGKDRPVCKVIDSRSGPLALLDGTRRQIVRAAASRLGFHDVW